MTCLGNACRVAVCTKKGHIQKQPTFAMEILSLYNLPQIWIFRTQNRSFTGWLHTICNCMLLWNDLLSSRLNWCFNDAWNVQISSVSFVSVLCASLKIGHRCFYVIFMRLKLSIQRGPFILFTWEQVSKCQFQWFIFHVRIEMSHPSIIPALIKCHGEIIYFRCRVCKTIEIHLYQ